MKTITAISLALCLGSSSVAHAADRRAEGLNANAVGIVAAEESLLPQAVAMAKAVDHVDNLRALPIVGRGSLQALNDLMFLKGVDTAILSSDSLVFASRHDLYTDELGRIGYLSKLSNNGIVILSRAEFSNIEGLKQRKIATGRADSDSFVAGDLIFAAAGIEYARSPLTGFDAVTALQNGQVDAVVLSMVESYDVLSAVPKGSGLKLLPISFNDGLAKAYSPAIIEGPELPNLLAEGEEVETVSSAIVLAVFDRPKSSSNQQKIQRFNTALRKQYYPTLSAKHVTNFSAAVPGWKPYTGVKESYFLGPALKAGVFVALRQ